MIWKIRRLICRLIGHSWGWPRQYDEPPPGMYVRCKRCKKTEEIK